MRDTLNTVGALGVVVTVLVSTPIGISTFFSFLDRSSDLSALRAAAYEVTAPKFGDEVDFPCRYYRPKKKHAHPGTCVAVFGDVENNDATVNINVTLPDKENGFERQKIELTDMQKRNLGIKRPQSSDLTLK